MTLSSIENGGHSLRTRSEMHPSPRTLGCLTTSDVRGAQPGTTGSMSMVQKQFERKVSKDPIPYTSPRRLIPEQPRRVGSNSNPITLDDSTLSNVSPSRVQPAHHPQNSLRHAQRHTDPLHPTYSLPTSNFDHPAPPTVHRGNPPPGGFTFSSGKASPPRVTPHPPLAGAAPPPPPCRDGRPSCLEIVDIPGARSRRLVPLEDRRLGSLAPQPTAHPMAAVAAGNAGTAPGAPRAVESSFMRCDPMHRTVSETRRRRLFMSPVDGAGGERLVSSLRCDDIAGASPALLNKKGPVAIPTGPSAAHGSDVVAIADVAPRSTFLHGRSGRMTNPVDPSYAPLQWKGAAKASHGTNTPVDAAAAAAERAAEAARTKTQIARVAREGRCGTLVGGGAAALGGNFDVGAPWREPFVSASGGERGPAMQGAQVPMEPAAPRGDVSSRPVANSANFGFAT